MTLQRKIPAHIRLCTLFIAEAVQCNCANQLGKMLPPSSCLSNFVWKVYIVTDTLPIQTPHAYMYIPQRKQSVEGSSTGCTAERLRDPPEDKSKTTAGGSETTPVPRAWNQQRRQRQGFHLPGSKSDDKHQATWILHKSGDGSAFLRTRASEIEDTSAFGGEPNRACATVRAASAAEGTITLLGELGYLLTRPYNKLA